MTAPAQPSLAARFDALPATVAPATIEGLTGVFAFALPGVDGGAWTVRVDAGTLRVEAGADPSADVHVAASAEDWSAIVAGELDQQLAYRTGRLRVTGDMVLAQRVRTLLGF